jgi:hypothetical protein
MSFIEPPPLSPSYEPLQQPERNYTPQSTLQYSLFLKRAIVESLQDAWQNHPTRMVRSTKVDVDFTHDRFALPAVIIHFYEREMPNAGVGHQEWLPAPTDPNPDAPTEFIKYYHRLYKGDVAFEIWAKSSTDRDIVRDALIEVLAMADATLSGYVFLERLYLYLNQTPYGLWHFPVLNLDLITGYGENQAIAPWAPEDALHYSVTYRVPIFGEFYSPTPVSPNGSMGLVSEVDVYPWVPGIDPPPQDVNSSAYYAFNGWPEGSTTI